MTDSIKILTSAFQQCVKYNDTTFIVKCSGSVLQDNELLKAFAEDVASLKSIGVNIVIVHDGSDIINLMMDKFGFKSSAANIPNMDHANVEIVEMILSGYLNQKIVSQINASGGSAIGISGKDAQFMIAKRSKIARYDHNVSEKVLNFGFLGDLSLLNPDILMLLEDSGLVPVISPIATGEDGRTYRLDADDIAGALSAILSAVKLIFVTDNPTIHDSKGKAIVEMDSAQAYKILNEEKTNESISGKLRASIMALEQNAERVHIIDGKIKHSLLLELFTEDASGTKINRL